MELILIIITLTCIAIPLIYFFTKSSSSSEQQISTAKGPELPVLHIYYGSQTGLAYKFSEELQELLPFKTKISSLEDYESIPANRMNLFIVATHYEGNPTDNAESFYQFLEK